MDLPKYRIVADGSRHGVNVFDPDGKPLKGIKSITVRTEGSLLMAEITLLAVMPELDIVAPTEVKQC